MAIITSQINRAQSCRGAALLCWGCQDGTLSCSRFLQSFIWLLLCLGACKLSLGSRLIHDPSVYCPPEPASGQLVFKSVDGQNTLCTPSAHDEVGSAVYTCWRFLTIEINGCQVTLRPDESQVVGAGRLPCRFFRISGNLTGTGVEAQVWADVDGPGLLSYYTADPQAVEALRFDSPRQLVRDLWAFLRSFTADLRFADDSWIDDYSSDHAAAAAVAAIGDSDSAATQSASVAAAAAASKRLLAIRAAEAAGGLPGAQKEEEGGLRSSLASRHGPMRVYRPSETRVVLKMPTGCKYRYTVNYDSRVFESPTQHHPHVQWRTIGLTVALLSVVVAVVGLGACTYFSHRHAEYVSTYWEYQAVKDQLGSELPAATYERLFGELPKSAAEAARTAAAATAAAAAESAARDRRRAAHAAGAHAAAAPLLSPAVQQCPAVGLHAEAGEAPVVGAGEPDGISSRSSSAEGSEIAAAADEVLAAQEGPGKGTEGAAAVVTAVAVEDAPPVLEPSSSAGGKESKGKGGKPEKKGKK